MGAGSVPRMHLVSTRRRRQRRRLPEGCGRLAEQCTVRAVSRQSVLWGDCDHGGFDAYSGKVLLPAREGLGGGDSALPGAGLEALGRGLGFLRGRWRRRMPTSLREPSPSARSLPGSFCVRLRARVLCVFSQKLRRGFLNCLWLSPHIFLLRATGTRFLSWSDGAG